MRGLLLRVTVASSLVSEPPEAVLCDVCCCCGGIRTVASERAATATLMPSHAALLCAHTAGLGSADLQAPAAASAACTACA